MAQVKIEITFDPGKETLEQALASLQSKVPAVKAETGNVTAAATTGPKTKKTADPTPAATDETSAPAPAEDQAAPAAETEPSASPSEETQEEEKPVSKTDVRAIATSLSKAGKRNELQAIFKEFGATKLSEIKESDYPALMRKLVAVNG